MNKRSHAERQLKRLKKTETKTEDGVMKGSYINVQVVEGEGLESMIKGEECEAYAQVNLGGVYIWKTKVLKAPFKWEKKMKWFPPFFRKSL